MAEEHLSQIASVIEKVDADIINIVEVQNCNVLKKLNAKLPKMKYLPYLLQGTDSATGQNVGFLTRVDPIQNLARTDLRVNYPLPGTKCDYTGTKGTYGVSKHYYTTFKIPGLPLPLALIGLHFLAFPDRTDRCVQREAQASVIQAVAKELGRLHLIILGDVNDFDGSVQDASNNKPISSVLDILKGNSLMNIAEEVTPVAERYSCWYDANGNCKLDPHELSMIDHLLLSSDLRGILSDADFYHGYSPSCTSLFSDHWPVVATLDLSGFLNSTSF